MTINSHRIPNTNGDFEDLGEMNHHLQSENEFKTDFNEDFLDDGGRSGRATNGLESKYKGTTQFSQQGISLQNTQILQGA